MVRFLGSRTPPVTVFPIGKHFFLIDGHHRLEAYKGRTKGFKVVPVEVFEGTFRDAWKKSLESNIHTKLPMTQEDISEAAWRIVVLDKIKPLTAIEEMTDVASATIKRMSTTKNKMINEEGLNPQEFTWKQARQRKVRQEFDEGAFEKLATDNAGKIRKALRQSHIDNVTLMKRTIEILSSRLDDGLAQAYRDDTLTDDDI